MKKKNTYNRFWVNHGKNIPLDETGFLRDPESKWFHAYFDEPVFTTKELSSHRCLLLLGEPGIGKSTELKNLIEFEAKNDHRSVHFNLRDYDSKGDLKDSVFTDETVQKWMKESDEPLLSIYLDSLDEALLEAKRIAVGVYEILKELKKYGSITIRLACRTSDLPSGFNSDLESLFTDSILAVELAPLRNIDVVLAAQENNLDGEKFLQAIQEKELGVLASRPITLNMLLSEFSKTEAISDNILETYKKGCLYLLDDSESRKEANYGEELTPEQRLMIAERMAASVMLCNKSSIYTGILSEGYDIDLHIDEIDAGSEINQHNSDEVDISKNKINETLHTALFKPLGGRRFSFTHQTFAEYLAAGYLIRNKFTFSLLHDLLIINDGVSEGVVPQLKQVALWISMMHKKFFKRLIDIDPELLLKSNLAYKDEKRNRKLLKSLFNHVSKGKINPRGYRSFKFYKYLKFRGIEKFLRKKISKKRIDNHSKFFALDIIEAIGLEEMADDLIELALKKKNHIELREYSLQVLSQFELPKHGKKLLSLLDVDGDELNRLKAKATKCLYAELIPIEKVIELLSQSDELQRTLISQAGYHLIEKSGSAELIKLLEWAGDNFQKRGFPDYNTNYFWDEIILEGVKRVDDPNVLYALAIFIFKKIEKRFSIFESTQSERSYNEFREHTEARREIVEIIVSKFTETDDLAYNLRRYQQNLVIDEDFDWVIDHIKCAKSKKEGKVWSEILIGSFNPSEVEQINKVLFIRENESIKEVFKYWLTPIDIKSEEAQDARENYEEHWGKKDRPSGTVSPSEIIQESLEELKDRNIDYFCGLEKALSLSEGDQYYTKERDFFIEKYPGWISGTDHLREQVLKYALVFLEEAQPGSGDWINDMRSLSAYKALRLLKIFSPKEFLEISDTTLEKWLRPFIYFEVSDGLNAGTTFLPLYFQKFKSQVIAYICELIKNENEKHDGYVFVLRHLGSIFDKELADNIFNLLRDDELKANAIETIKDKLIDFGHSETLAFITSNLNKDETDGFVRDAFLIAKYSPDDFFNTFWSEFEEVSELSHKIIGKIAREERHEHEFLAKISEEQLGLLYIWLEKNYPEKNDIRASGPVTIEMQIGYLRRYTLNNLTSRGTEASCNQMQKIISEFPDQKWLKLRLEEAEQAYRKENWKPITVEQLLEYTRDMRPDIFKTDLTWFGLGFKLKAIWKKYIN